MATDRLDLDVYSGEIQALLGENGAGKTTLMQILYGLYRPDAGEIWIDGKRMVRRSPKEAIRAGIDMVFQDFTLIPSLIVAENIALAAPGSRVLMRRQSLMAHIQEPAVRYELPIEPSCPVWQLSIGEQQRFEIFKLLPRLGWHSA